LNKTKTVFIIATDTLHFRILKVDSTKQPFVENNLGG